MFRKKIDWLNLSLEFVVVLIGILLAFQLNEFGTRKKQNRIIKEHLKSIQVETNSNLYFLNNQLKRSKDVLRDSDTLLQLIANKGDIELINQKTFSLLSIGSVYFKKNAYNTFVQSGDIRFMKDFTLKSKTIDVYEYFVWVESFDEFATDQFNEGYYPYFKENFDLINAKAQERSVYETKIFLNSIGVYQFAMRQQIGKYKDAIREAEKYMDYLEKIVGEYVYVEEE